MFVLVINYTLPGKKFEEGPVFLLKGEHQGISAIGGKLWFNRMDEGNENVEGVGGLNLEITIYDKEGLRDKPSLIKYIQNSRSKEHEYPGWCWWPEDCMFQHFFIHTYISQFCKFTNYYILKSFLL